MKGWICPVCERGVSPAKDICPCRSPKDLVTKPSEPGAIKDPFSPENLENVFFREFGKPENLQSPKNDSPGREDRTENPEGIFNILEKISKDAFGNFQKDFDKENQKAVNAARLFLKDLNEKLPWQTKKRNLSEERDLWEYWNRRQG